MSVDCDLLVVGLGPVGDVMAALARLHGLSVIAIDRALTIHDCPRAAVFDDEVMRIFQMAGVAERMVPHTRTPDRYQFLTANGEVLLDFGVGGIGRFGWPASHLFHQPACEAVLRARLRELGVDVRLGVAFTGLTEDADVVSVGIAVDGTPSSIRARYVVACDGGSSPVRVALGIDLDDYGFDEPWLVVDVLIDSDHAPPVVTQQICDPARPVTHMAMTDGRFRWEFMVRPGESATELASDASLRTLLAPWGNVDHMRFERTAVYNFHALVARRWRHGRVLLAGDAAHQMPPFAGQGMCSGIRDAANLAWKLAAVVRGDASPDILDSYQDEREPHTRAIIETAIAMGRVVCLLDPAAAAARDAGMLARKAAGEQDVSMAYPDLSGGLLTTTPGAGALLPQPVADGSRFDDLLGLDAALIGRGLPGGGDAVRRIDLDTPAATPFALALDAWLADLGAAAILLRPDRHVFGTGDARDLIQQWNEVLGTKIPA